jgi:hypothetical protein
MKRSLSSIVLFLVVLLSLPAMGWAQDFRNVELNPFVSFNTSTNSNFEIVFPQAIVPIQEQFKLNDTLGGGFRFNINTTRHWGEEAFFSYQPNKAHFIRTTAPRVDQAYDIRIYNFALNAMYYLNEDEGHHTRPFLTAGIGATVNQPTAHASQVANDPLQGNLPGFGTSAEFAFNYGAGVKHYVSEAIGFRVDARGYVAPNPTFGLARKSSDPNAVVFPASGAMQTLEVSAGIIFRFTR